MILITAVVLKGGQPPPAQLEVGLLLEVDLFV
jgi:hypothetical protein